MKHKNLLLILLLSIFIISLISTGVSYALENQVLSDVKDGYRILVLEKNNELQEFTVYRGDYIKFKLPKGLSESVAFFPTLKEQKKLTTDLKTTSYFKMKQIGAYPFQVDSLKGRITVIEFQQARYRELTSKEADEYIKTNKPLVLDVRTQREYVEGHLENSILIPVQELQIRINELDAHKNNAILIYCATGNRSTVASKILIDSGFAEILNLKHGIADWAKKRYPVVR